VSTRAYVDRISTNAGSLKLTFIVDTWVSDHYGDPHVEGHPNHPAA
jgi:hypothetical protein